MNKLKIILAVFIICSGVGSAMADDKTLEADVVVYGDAAGGVTSAVQAARMGKKVILVSQYGHLGGMSSSGLGWSDIGNTEILGGLAREFYHLVYQHYQTQSAWIHESRSGFGNAGQGTAALDPAKELASIFEPKVAESIFDAMVREAGVKVVKGRLDLTKGAGKSGSRINAIRLEGGVIIKGKCSSMPATKAICLPPRACLS